MYRLKILFLTLLLTSSAFAKGRKSSGGDVFVKGHTRSNGTYVDPHYRSAPNGTTTDNWSTKGNVNPYTGEEGTKEPTDGGLIYQRSSSDSPTDNTSQNGSTSSLQGGNLQPSFKPEVPGGVSSRYTLGRSKLSLNLDSQSGSGKVGSDYDIEEAKHWDVISIRGDSGGEFTLFYEDQDFRSSIAGYRNDSNLKTYGARVSYLPIRKDFGLVRLQAHLGLGAGLMVLRNNEAQTSGYTEMSGPIGVAGAGLDVIFFRLIGASILWNGSYGEFQNSRVSDRTLEREQNLNATMKRDPTITQSSVTFGVMLNIDL